MGLHTSHECFSGSYSGFMAFRLALHRAIVGNIEAGVQDLKNAWSHDDYADQTVPINVLMNHSDCEGEIAWSACDPIADALEDLIPRIPVDAVTFGRNAREEVWTFISGLRKAHRAGEAVVFG